MKKPLFLLLYSIAVIPAMYSQDFLGFVNSNYAGITGAVINPANLADNRMRVDINILGWNLMAGNNYYGLKTSAIKLSSLRSNSTSTSSDYLQTVFNGKTKSAFFSNRFALPSFMISLGKKSAIGLSINSRSYLSLDGVSESLAKLVSSDIGRNAEFDVNALIGKNLKNKQLSFNAMSWMEYGVTFAHVLIADGKHFLKAGITPKLLQGLGSAYLNVNNFEFRFENDPIRVTNDTLQVLTMLKTNVNYSHSDNLDHLDKNFQPEFSFNYLGFGIDAGLVYEWRPKYEQYKYDMDGKTGLWRRDQNKYKLKVGLSLVDLGSIKYKRGHYSKDFSIQVNSLKYRLLDLNAMPVFDFDKLIDSLGEVKTVPDFYRMATPLALSMQVDYHLGSCFFINFTPYYAFQMNQRNAKVHDITVLSLSPRVDHKWFGFSIPLSYNSMYAKADKPFSAGAMARLGPLVLGTNDFTSFFGENIFGANFYFLLKLPIPYGAPKDRDGDAVSNRKDQCKDQYGTWEFQGCPDKDLDHVEDAVDKCPDVAGLPQFNGCPDSDLDSVPDFADACPLEKGLKIFDGCPDSDGDQIPDKSDDCPLKAGTKEFNGCADSDNDGLVDHEDFCPDLFGLKVFKGCPDRDLDSIPDHMDACPDQAGLSENNGCPPVDSDQDGIIDKEDSCPQVPGVAALNGCPPSTVVVGPTTQTVQMAVAERKIIEKAFASLEFATAKDVIKPISYKGLDELAKLLKSHSADWKIKLIGHTDNAGDPVKNMILSEKRAKAVGTYLIKKGVAPEQVLTEWHGSEQPIADNKTAAGKQKNRRVEMKIVLKE